MPRLSRRTLRGLPPLTRQLAKLNNELASTHRRISNLLPKVETAERDAEAMRAHWLAAEDARRSALASLDGTLEQEEEI